MPKAKTIPDLQKFRAMLKSRGLRATQARLLVHTAMMSLEHACAEQVAERLAQEQGAAISTASVYNVLEQMAVAGVYAFRMSADGKRYYDVCNFSHTHLYDRKNGIYRNLPEGIIREAVKAVLKQHRFRGYTVESVDVQVVCHRRGQSR